MFGILIFLKYIMPVYYEKYLVQDAYIGNNGHKH